MLSKVVTCPDGVEYHIDFFKQSGYKLAWLLHECCRPDGLVVQTVASPTSGLEYELGFRTFLPQWRSGVFASCALKAFAVCVLCVRCISCLCVCWVSIYICCLNWLDLIPGGCPSETRTHLWSLLFFERRNMIAVITHHALRQKRRSAAASWAPSRATTTGCASS